MAGQPASKRSKLGVDIDPKLKKRLDIEAARTGLHLKEVVDLRIRDSIRHSPRLARLADPGPGAPTP